MGSLALPTAAQRQADQNSPAEVITPANDPVPGPAPSIAEISARFFPSDAGGIEHLWNAGFTYDVAPTPLETPPNPIPESSANALNHASDNVNVHVGPESDVPSPYGQPVPGVTEDFTPNPPPQAAPSAGSTWSRTWRAERDRLAALFAPKPVAGD